MPATSSTTASQKQKATPYHVPIGFSSTSITRVLPRNKLEGISRLTRQDRSPTPLLSEKWKELGSGSFPIIKVEEMRIGEEHVYHSTGMSIQFPPKKIVINLDKQSTTIKNDELLRVKVTHSFFLTSVVSCYS